MLTLQTFRLGDLSTNTYIISNPDTKSALVIDPADDANFIAEQLLYQNLSPRAIIATHGHFDHLLAAWELELAFNIPTVIHEKDLPLLKHLSRSASWWLKKRIIEKPPQNLLPVNGTTTSSATINQLADFSFDFIHTPGHTPGGLCLYFANEKWLISGDTLFADGAVGRTDLPYCSKNDLNTSIQTLSRFPSNTTIYPGHGETDNLKKSLSSIGAAHF